jgi:hypothetical protein
MNAEAFNDESGGRSFDAIDLLSFPRSMCLLGSFYETETGDAYSARLRKLSGFKVSYAALGESR